MASIQIQSVLYGNEKENLLRALDALQQSVINCRAANGTLTDFTVAYGDASPEAIFTTEEEADIRQKYQNEFSFVYRVFGFNSGSARGHNLLAEDCAADYMQIMNPDVVVCPDYFLHIMEPFSSSECGMVEARQSPVEHPKDYDVKTGETCWATTACAVFPTTLFRKIGGFDNDTFFLYCDDVDFSWRIRLEGKKIIYQPTACVYHAKRLNASGSWKPTYAEVYYSAEAALFMAYKWSADKRCKTLLKRFSKSGDPVLQKAATEFESRKAANRLPAQLDREHRVALFTSEGNYAPHRFRLQ